jgi:hypothetical protein
VITDSGHERLNFQDSCGLWFDPLTYFGAHCRLSDAEPRIGGFSFFISIIPSLRPVVGLKELDLPASHLGFLFTSMAVGSVLSGAFIIPWARAKYSPQRITGIGSASHRVVPTFLAAAVFALVLMIIVRVIPALQISIDFIKSLSFESAPTSIFSQNLDPGRSLAPQDGPVSITAEFNIDPNRRGECIELMRDARMIFFAKRKSETLSPSTSVPKEACAAEPQTPNAERQTSRLYSLPISAAFAPPPDLGTR